MTTIKQIARLETQLQNAPADLIQEIEQLLEIKRAAEKLAIMVNKRIKAATKS